MNVFGIARRTLDRSALVEGRPAFPLPFRPYTSPHLQFRRRKLGSALSHRQAFSKPGRRSERVFVTLPTRPDSLRPAARIWSSDDYLNTLRPLSFLPHPSSTIHSSTSPFPRPTPLPRSPFSHDHLRELRLFLRPVLTSLSRVLNLTKHDPSFRCYTLLSPRLIYRKHHACSWRWFEIVFCNPPDDWWTRTHSHYSWCGQGTQHDRKGTHDWLRCMTTLILICSLII